MSFAELDASTQNADPIFLVLATRGNETWRFTSSGRDINALGEVWKSSPVKPGKVTQTPEMLKSTLDLAFPLTDAFARQYLGHVPERLTSITLYRGHGTDIDQEFRVAWKGRIANIKIGARKITLECEPIFTSLRRPGLRARYQKSCRHAIYGRGCGLNKDDWREDGQVESINGVTVSAVFSMADSIAVSSDADIPVDLVGNGGASKVASVTVTTLPLVTEGVLYLSDGITPVVVNTPISASQAASLVFTPTQGFSGPVSIVSTSLFVPGYFRGGVLEMPTGETRFIVDHVGGTLTLIRPMPLLESALAEAGTGLAVNLYPGCDQTRKRCLELFDNLDNHGGWFIPKRNPMDGSSIV